MAIAAKEEGGLTEPTVNPFKDPFRSNSEIGLFTYEREQDIVFKEEYIITDRFDEKITLSFIHKEELHLGRAETIVKLNNE